MSIPFIDAHLAANLAASFGAVATLALARSVTLRRAAARPAAAHDGTARLRLRFALAIGAILVAIWFAEIQALIWSLTAVAVACVIATKELIQCAMGALMGAASRSFRVGDRLEIDGTYGQILASGILTTTVAEMERGPGGRRLTGRRIVIPNARLFTADLRVDAPGASLPALRFHIVFEPLVSAQKAIAVLEESLARFCEPFAAGEEGAAPLVGLSTTDAGRLRLDVLCLVPAEEGPALEREVKMEFLEWLWAEAQGRRMRHERPTADNDAFNPSAFDANGRGVGL